MNKAKDGKSPSENVNNSCSAYLGPFTNYITSQGNNKISKALKKTILGLRGLWTEREVT